jgi:2-polyprenyl-6-methoxyphenol hydroxylase-like FAD-dependent oxidoreductase
MPRRAAPLEGQYQRIAAVFADAGWEVPRLLEAMRHAKDLYSDTVSQIRMPVWSSGRVALVGDAAFAPSFRSGQGTSLALVGAYVLAGELASQDDPSEAFATYERVTRPFVEANQALAIKGNGFLPLPRTPQEVEARNQILAGLAAGRGDGVRNGHAREAHSMLRLPDYAQWFRQEDRK